MAYSEQRQSILGDLRQLQTTQSNRSNWVLRSRTQSKSSRDNPWQLRAIRNDFGQLVSMYSD